MAREGPEREERGQEGTSLWDEGGAGNGSADQSFTLQPSPDATRKADSSKTSSNSEATSNKRSSNSEDWDDEESANVRHMPFWEVMINDLYWYTTL